MGYRNHLWRELKGEWGWDRELSVEATSFRGGGEQNRAIKVQSHTY